jgi:hypothetical protein
VIGVFDKVFFKQGTKVFFNDISSNLLDRSERFRTSYCAESYP